MKTEVVLKLRMRMGKKIESMTFNENRSCIEMCGSGRSVAVRTFNENRSCIEILKQLYDNQLHNRLMKTEVVLKFWILL